MVVALKRGECAERGLLSGHILRWVVGLAGFIRDKFNPVGLIVELFIRFQTRLSDFGTIVDVKAAAFGVFVIYADVQPLVYIDRCVVLQCVGGSHVCNFYIRSRIVRLFYINNRFVGKFRFGIQIIPSIYFASFVPKSHSVG